MKRFGLFVFLLSLTVAAPAMAVQDIGIFADAAGTSCEIADPGGNVQVKVYIVQTSPVQPVVGSAWKLEWDAGMSMDYVSDDTSPYSKVGDAVNGVSIFYFTCTAGTFVIDTVTFLSHGTSAPCSYMRLGPHPTQNRVIIQCNFAGTPFHGGEGIVNPNDNCHCTLATEPTTWGRVKSLYR